MSKENEAILKSNVNKWLTRAENLKRSLNEMSECKQRIEKMTKESEAVDSQEMDDKETSLKQCTIQ
jgi:hypothetical protein